MCGICGIAWTDSYPPPTSDVVDAMTQVLSHRGPDDQGSWSEPGIHLGFRRLSIIDLQGGQQPMSNEDGTVWVVFNGEIYNFKALRNRIEGNRHTLRTLSDTEVLVHLYEDEGPAFLQRLRGMFAIALWDCEEQQLLLARDRMGVKPLVYHVNGERIAFASELKSLMLAPDVPRQLDPTSLDHYLALQYVPHPRTILRDVHKLPPAHYGIWKDGSFRVYRYWQLDPSSELEISYGDAKRQFRELLLEATQLRMEADVPLGAFLSGGVDSTIIVGLMQQLSDRPVRTFSIGFPVPEFDETRYARMAADHLRTDHHHRTVDPDCVGILPELIWHFDEPFGDSSAIPTYYVSQVAREHVKVALTGDAGDELFAGYPRYRAVALASLFDRMPRELRWCLASPLWRWLPASSRQKSRRRRFKKLVAHLNKPPFERYANWICIFDELARAALYQEDFIGAIDDEDPMDFLRARYVGSRQRDPVTRISLLDLSSYLPCDLLTKVDLASMAHGLECRSPFLDHRVVEFAAALPIDYKFRRFKGKRLLKDAFADLLPPEIRRRPKMGFGVPLDSWFRNEMSGFLKEVLLDSRTAERPYFRREAVANLISDHLSGRWDHSYRLWSLLVFELWQRTFLDAEPVRVPPVSALRV